MKIDVSVSIDAQQPVQQAVSQCWAQMFLAPKYAGEKGGPGWEAVRHQVVRYIESLDLTAEIERAAKAKLPAMVDDEYGFYLPVCADRDMQGTAPGGAGEPR